VFGGLLFFSPISFIQFLHLEITVSASLQKYLLAPFSIYLVLVLSLMLFKNVGAWRSF